MTNVQICQTICEKLGVEYDDILTKNRKRDIVEARQIIALILYEKGDTPIKISRLLKQNRATILYHLKVLRSHIALYPILKKQYEICKILISPTPIPHENQTQQNTTRRASYSFERRTET